MWTCSGERSSSANGAMAARQSAAAANPADPCAGLYEHLVAVLGPVAVFAEDHVWSVRPDLGAEDRLGGVEPARIRGLIRHGNSGGPVVDGSGHVLSTVFAASVGEKVAGGYGIPNDLAIRVRAGVAAHQVAVMPFVSGGGIKNKLLEAAAMARPRRGSRDR